MKKNTVLSDLFAYAGTMASVIAISAEILKWFMCV